MTDLLTLLREHDLPPRWDGLAVLWRGWEYDRSHEVFICPPPPPRVCEGCGEPVLHRGFSAQSVNRGLVAVSTVLSHDDLRYEEQNRQRLGALAGKRKPRALWRLHVWRCQLCKLDTVWDTDADEWFTLDDSDYGPDGSVMS